MNIEYFEDPWFHFVIDDFLPEKLFNAVKHYSNLYKDRTNIAYSIPSGTIRDDLEYQLIKTWNNLDFKPPFDLNNACYNIQISGSKYPVCQAPHCDIETKIMSLVVFLSDQAIGTILTTHTDQCGSYKNIEWKPNRCMGFFPIKDVTWHRTSTRPQDDTRIVLVLNIMSEDGSDYFTKGIK